MSCTGHHPVMPAFDPAIQRSLSKHGGVISRAELLELGLSSSAIGRRVRSGELLPVVPGVYRPAALRLTPELMIRAVALRLGPTCVVAGRSAAWWHGLTSSVTEPVSVILPPGAWPSTLHIVRAARRSLDPADRVVVRGLAVTGRARTVLDCADSVDAEDIRDAALQRGQVSDLGGGRGLRSRKL